MAMKCKDVDHVRARPTTAPGDPPGVWGVTVVHNGTCKNDRSYNGVLYVLTRHGKLGMQMFPTLAQALPEQLLVAADAGTGVKIEHKVLRVWNPLPYAVLTPSAARDLAAELATAVGG